MRVGVVLLGRLERDWMAIGIILNLSNCPLVSMSLSQSVRVEFWSYNESREMFGMKLEQRIWGKSGQLEAIMRIGVVLLGRLERDWMPIGIILNLTNCLLVSVTVYSGWVLILKRMKRNMDINGLAIGIFGTAIGPWLAGDGTCWGWNNFE
jgi:hypothetical protein